MTVSFWQDEQKYHKKKIINSDIIIIGGGVAGLSSAYWIQKQDPNLNITLIDKGKLGSGATGRNAGFITCGSVEHFNRLSSKNGIETAEEIWKFSEENLNLLRTEIIQNCQKELFFEEKGSFSLASTENELIELQESANIMSKLNINVETLKVNQIATRLGVKNFVGGIKYCGCFH